MNMVGVAQLVEHPVVVRDVAGSSPVAHPTFSLCDSRKTEPNRIFRSKVSPKLSNLALKTD